MERGDLVVVEVGGDERGRGVDVIAPQHRGGVHPLGLERGREPVEVVRADRGAEQRSLAEQCHGVRDVRRRAAAPALEMVDQERDVEQMRLVGQDVVAESPVEDHDGVEGDRSGHGDASHGGAG